MESFIYFSCAVRIHRVIYCVLQYTNVRFVRFSPHSFNCLLDLLISGFHKVFGLNASESNEPVSKYTNIALKSL